MSSRIVRATWRNPVSETKTLKKEKKKEKKPLSFKKCCQIICPRWEDITTVSQQYFASFGVLGLSSLIISVRLRNRSFNSDFSERCQPAEHQTIGKPGPKHFPMLPSIQVANSPSRTLGDLWLIFNLPLRGVVDRALLLDLSSQFWNYTARRLSSKIPTSKLLSSCKAEVRGLRKETGRTIKGLIPWWDLLGVWEGLLLCPRLASVCLLSSELLGLACGQRAARSC